ncbi:ATP-binding protein [Simkania negevensis]|uniref:Uncharacterized protein Mb2031c n=1 Tax=Simkania negevensis (strain ATCC VR-1471 / DSM 27360 / Z) TaxID=331113 RepID=F8L9D5_SIMNZ|nr:ATP-binding protein [Simkania negevensis]CCB89461.1 uncharacterized protein Mb2031c [Simkania negevensis Z]
MLRRNIEEELKAFLKIMPVVLITGARQTGKTTLAKSIAQKKGYTFYTFDDALTLANAKRDPSGWLESLPKPVIIDEVQRVPEIFLSIKKDVDENKKPGRYLITGSANPFLIPRLGDSLAGRIGILNMFPFSYGEIIEKKERFISTIFETKFSPKNLSKLSHETLYEILLWGGFPPVQDLVTIEDLNRWMKSYLQTIMERDVRDLANIEGLREFPNLFRLLASRTGTLLNVSQLSRSLGMVHVTLKRYLRLLEALYFVYLLPSWHSNQGKRLTKSPKMYLCDTAILTTVLGMDSDNLEGDPTFTGQVLESFVFSELLKQKSWSNVPFELYHFRDRDIEVDFVLERFDGTLVGIEVKSANTIHNGDLKGLKHLKTIAKKSFSNGIILHLGTQIQQLDENIWAFPIQSLWEL